MDTQKKNIAGRYQKDAIAKIYKDDEEFVVIGLTGRTGSGCSTVARILGCERDKIRHSLFSGHEPRTNDQRKERIVSNFFHYKWSPFFLIQVRSIITTFILEKDISISEEYYKSVVGGSENLQKFVNHLAEMKSSYEKANENCESDEYVTYYTESLPKSCDALKEIIEESAFVSLYQAIGENIRLSGDAYDTKLKEGKFFSLASRVDGIISNIRKYCANTRRDACIVIDAIRNPLEAIYFQGRYAAFYLMAVSCPEEDRLSRLRALNYSEDAIHRLDGVEYPEKPKKLHDTEFYSVQDIQSCLQRADLYISNPNEKSEVAKFQFLANQVIRFICLIRRPGLVTPTAVERTMQIAYTAKLNSGCISRQVGAAVTDMNFSVRSIGWNDTPHGQVPCNLRSREDLLEGRDLSSYSEFEKSDAEYLLGFRESSQRFIPVRNLGRNNSYCFKTEYNLLKDENNQVHTRSLHAEENAFLQLSKYGSAGIENGVLFTTASPCELCAKKAYQLGIKTIYYIDPYPGIAVRHVLMGGSKNPELVLFSGAIGKAFHRLYTPVLPYKDELYAITT